MLTDGPIGNSNSHSINNVKKRERKNSTKMSQELFNQMIDQLERMNLNHSSIINQGIKDLQEDRLLKKLKESGQESGAETNRLLAEYFTKLIQSNREDKERESNV